MKRQFLLLAVLLIGILLAASFVLYASPLTASADSACVGEWWLLSSKAARDICAEEKIERVKKQFADETAAKLVEPQSTSISETPNPILFPESDTSPDWASKIEPVSKEEVVEIPALKYATSVWRLGGIKSRDETDYAALYIFTMPSKGTKHASLAMYVFNGTKEQGAKYNRVWESPDEIGVVTITDIKQYRTDTREGVVTFSTTSGKSGAIDLVSGVWRFTP